MKQLFEGHKTLTFLTGAGVSTDSGIPDFQSTDSSWPYSKSREELISLAYWRENPEGFWRVYREVFGEKLNAAPNPVHKWIASLEENHTVFVITQNVDELHTAAGSSNVLEVHGNAKLVECLNCKTHWPASLFTSELVPTCQICSKALKPKVVLFGENLSEFKRAKGFTLQADVLVTMGTSLKVAPVNLLPHYFSQKFGAASLWVNKNSAKEYAHLFTDSFVGELTDFLKTVS